MVRAVSAAVARRFLVRRHMLSPPRALSPSPEEVLTVIARLGSLQFDPLAAPGARNHDLVLHSRIRGYQRGWCERWLYGEASTRRLFEVYNKSLNIVAVEEMAAHRLAWERAQTRHDAGIFKSHAKTVGAVLDKLRVGGAVSTREITREHGRSLEWYWAPTAEGRAVLEALFETGRVAIARREGNLRRYDLSERVFPEEVLSARVTREESLRQRLFSRHRAVGMLARAGAPEVFTGTGTPEERARSLASLCDLGSLTPLCVEGVKSERYVLNSELSWLDTAPPDELPGLGFIAPLDPLVWDRGLLRELFGFDYKWEVYTPEAQRKFGYYVLPMLFGDCFVGRIEPTVDREKNALVLRGVWLEAGFDAETPGFARALGEALLAFRVFTRCERVIWPRGAVATKLKRAIGCA